jgi:hypothetical protein
MLWPHAPGSYLRIRGARAENDGLTISRRVCSGRSRPNTERRASNCLVASLRESHPAFWTNRQTGSKGAPQLLVRGDSPETTIRGGSGCQWTRSLSRRCAKASWGNRLRTDRGSGTDLFWLHPRASFSCAPRSIILRWPKQALPSLPIGAVESSKYPASMYLCSPRRGPHPMAYIGRLNDRLS